jgi:hypothetical protein
VLCLLVHAPLTIWDSQFTLKGSQNPHLSMILELLSDTSELTSQERRELLSLFSVRNSSWLSSRVLAQLLVVLVRRRAVDLWGLVCPLLHLYSTAWLWEAAVFAFRVCTPSVLNRSRLVKVACLKSSRCRLMLRLCPLTDGRRIPHGDSAFRRAIVGLSHLKRARHRTAIMDLYWVCNASGESHYRHILNAMVESEDFRDAELLIPLLLRSPEPSDFDILTRLASTQTPMVAAMASEALNVCAPHWEKQRVKP